MEETVDVREGARESDSGRSSSDHREQESE